VHFIVIIVSARGVTGDVIAQQAVHFIVIIVSARDVITNILLVVYFLLLSVVGPPHQPTFSANNA